MYLPYSATKKKGRVEIQIFVQVNGILIAEMLMHRQK